MSPLEKRCWALVRKWRNSIAALDEIDAVITCEERMLCANQLSAALKPRRKRKAKR